MNFYLKTWNILKRFDIFGYNFPLRYQSETSYSTPCGLFFSLLSFSLLLSIIITYFSKMISYSSYTIVTNSIYRNNPPEINLNNFPFMYGILQNGDALKLDPSYVTIILERNVHIPYKDKFNHNKLNRTSHNIELEECNINHFQIYKNEFMEFNYKNYLCPKMGENLTFKGRYGDFINGYDILEMHVVKCENKTFNNKCKNKEEIEKYLENSYISLIYLSNSINHESTLNPISYFLKSELFSISLGNVKRYYYYFSKEKYITDNGIIFNNKKHYDFFQYKYTLLDFVHLELQKYYSRETLIEINFSCIEVETEYERIYLKFSDVVGIIGGWGDIIIAIFNFISYYFTKKSFVLEMCNSLMSHNFHKMITIKKDPKKTDRSSTTILFYKIKSLMKNNYILKNTDHLVNNNINICNYKTSSFRSNETSKNAIDVGFFKSRENKGFCFYFKYFIFPFSIIENYEHFQLYSVYTKVYHKFMSIDIIIPFILNNYICKDKIMKEQKE